MASWTALNRPLLVWLLLSTIWGSTWLVIKLGLNYLPPLTFAGVRFLVAIVPLIILLLIRKPPIPRAVRDWWLIGFTGVITFGINYGLVFWAETRISSGLTAILYTTLPLFGMLMAHFMITNERMNLPKVGGVIVGILGVSAIFFDQLQLEGKHAVEGVVGILFASCITAYADILVKNRGQHLNPLVLTLGKMVFGVVPLFLTGLLLEGNPFEMNWTPEAWLALFYLAWVGSSLTFVFLYWLIQRIHVTRTMLIPLASTLIAVVLGKVILGEMLNARTTLGGIAILAGLIISNFGYRNGRRKQLAS